MLSVLDSSKICEVEKQEPKEKEKKQRFQIKRNITKLCKKYAHYNTTKSYGKKCTYNVRINNNFTLHLNLSNLSMTFLLVRPLEFYFQIS